MHQIFSGPVAGDALLMLNYEHAAQLARLLTDERDKPPALDASDREVLMEIGNIVLGVASLDRVITEAEKLR